MARVSVAGIRPFVERRKSGTVHVPFACLSHILSTLFLLFVGGDLASNPARELNNRHE
ncbi:MAG: hypothetical protein ACYC24_01280 [Desulfobacteria bacterium]